MIVITVPARMVKIQIAMNNDNTFGKDQTQRLEPKPSF